MKLPDTLTSDQLKPLLAPASFIINTITKAKLFYLVPTTDMGAQNPRTLPREIIQEELIAVKKKGRPTKRDKAAKAKAALETLDKWLDTTAGRNDSSTHRLLELAPTATLYQYQINKEHLLKAVDGNVLDQGPLVAANLEVRNRLKQAEAIVATGVSHNLERVEKAVSELDDLTLKRNGGLLGLLEGAGKRE